MWLVELLEGKRVIGYKWVYKKKETISEKKGWEVQGLSSSKRLLTEERGWLSEIFFAVVTQPSG